MRSMERVITDVDRAQIDGLLAAGVEPTITLIHYDVPLELQKRYRGYQADDPTKLIEDFVSYAKLCFERFGDRVKRWLTINEVRHSVSEIQIPAPDTDK